MSGLLCGLGVLFLATGAAGREIDISPDLITFLVLLPAWLIGAGATGLYHLSERRVSYSFGDEVTPIVMLTTVWSWALLVFNSIVSSNPVPVLSSVSLWAGAIVFVLLFRAFVRAYLSRADWWSVRAVLVGSPDDLDRVASRIRRHPEFNIELVGSVQISGAQVLRRFRRQGSEEFQTEVGQRIDRRASRRHERADDEFCGPDPQASGRAYAEAVMQTVSDAEANRLIVTDLPSGLAARTEFLGALVGSGLHLDVVSGEPDALFSTATIQHLEGLSLLTVAPHRTNKASALVKRTLDVVLASGTLIVLSPMLAIIALRIKMTSPGPVLFQQERIGRNKSSFRIYKFRTMVADADARKDELGHLNLNANGDQRMFKIVGDPRITKFGARLRRLSLDELPQLWNVVMGDMSLVGPRPLIPEEAILVEGYHAERSLMRPGITGPWQTLGRSEIPFSEMVQLDYTYVATWTLGEDFRLLMRTVRVVATARGAY